MLISDRIRRGDNVVLVGMPGAGKSTIGVLLAKVMGCAFLDTDVFLQTREGRTLQTLLDAVGVDAFRALEARTLLALDVRRHVIATGGSAVYSDAAMQHLREHGVAIHLDLPLTALERRLRNFATRGVVMGAGQTLADLYAERQPLYRRYADIGVDCSRLRHDGVVARILAALGRSQAPAATPTATISPM